MMQQYMKVKELIAELSKYDGNMRVLLYAHGRCGVDEQDEVLGCYEEVLGCHEEEILRLIVNLKMNSLFDLMCIRNNTTVICLSEVFIQSSHRKTVTGYDIMKYISSPY